ncbi:MAG: hypothetical protein JW818_03810 [Pirellulales bacterium]|nr:hypothetical protein [Pirellulales bacterium]
MKLTLLARPALIDESLDAHGPALLLEGSWPTVSAPGRRDALDDRIDAAFEWIDLQASHWADQLARQAASADAASGPVKGITPAYLNALALRYNLVKLIRVVVYLTEVHPVGPADLIELIATRGQDEDYADLLVELAAATGAHLEIRWKDARLHVPTLPRGGRLRRWTDRAAKLLEPADGPKDSGHRVVLCGNPQTLDPVCAELLSRGCRVWWLRDRFCMRTWLKWRARGVGQLTCQGDQGRANRLCGALPEVLSCRGVNLTPALGHWLAERMQAEGRRQTRMVEQINAHFGRIQPDCLVLSDDTAPLARAAVHLARRHQATSFVVQHRAPVRRFDFAPLAADRLLAWGEASRWQLTAWGVPDDCILVTGAPQHDRHFHKFRDDVDRVISARVSAESGRSNGASLQDLLPKAGRRVTLPAVQRQGTPTQILLLGAVPPSDTRPDAIALHFNRRTYAQMLQMTLAAVGQIRGAELVIRPHPQSGPDPALAAAIRAVPELSVHVDRRGTVARLAAEADCVVSFLATAGLEATLSGVPVIQVLPPGSNGVAPHAWWGLVGNAKSQAELSRLLDRVVSGQWQPADLADGRVFDNYARPAAARVADAILSTDRRTAPRATPQPAAASVVD